MLCVDDAEVARLAEAIPRHVMRYGFSDAADVRATEVQQHGGSMRFVLHLPGEVPLPVRLNLPGRHNVLNSLAAAAIGWRAAERGNAD